MDLTVPRRCPLVPLVKIGLWQSTVLGREEGTATGGGVHDYMAAKIDIHLY